MKILNKLWTRNLIFIVLSVLIFKSLGYFDIFNERPQSRHIWRQCDGLSLALNYHQDKLPLFEPQLHHLFNGTGKTIGEFPIIYYVVGKLYNIFGVNEGIFRLFNFLLFYIGIFSLFHLGYRITNNLWASIFTAFFAWLSPIICYYSFNFLPNAPAIGMCYAGLFFIYSYFTSRKLASLILAILFFTLAGLLKATALICLASILFVYMVLCFIKKKPHEEAWFKQLKIWEVLALLIPILVLLLWVEFANDYKQTHGNVYFLLRLKPLWNARSNNIMMILEHLVQSKYHLHSFYSVFAFLFSLVLFLYTLINGERIFKLLIAACFLGCLAYFILFFTQFYKHDYYLIEFSPLLAFSILFGFNSVRQLKWKRVLYVCFVAIIVHSITYSKHILNRHYGKDHRFERLHDIEASLEAYGITKNKKVLIVGDHTVNAGLYLINRKGWCGKGSNRLASEQLEDYRNWGMEYILFLNKEAKSDLKYTPYLNEKIGTINKIPIYSVR